MQIYFTNTKLHFSVAHKHKGVVGKVDPAFAVREELVIPPQTLDGIGFSSFLPSFPSQAGAGRGMGMLRNLWAGTG